MASETLVISIDAMGGDHAPDSVLEGLSLIAKQGFSVRFLVGGVFRSLSCSR